MFFKKKKIQSVIRDDRCKATKIYMYICMMKMHYDTPENVIFEVQQSMKTLYVAMSDQTFNVYIFYFYMS